MTNKEYKTTNGSGIPVDKVQIYGERIYGLINENDGKTSTVKILEDAKSKDSPTHDYFIWDNTVAGEKYRLQQARHLYESIVEVVVVKDKENERATEKIVVVRSFKNVQDKETGERVVVTFKTVGEDDDYRKQELRDISAHMKRSAELIDVFTMYEKER